MSNETAGHASPPTAEVDHGVHGAAEAHGGDQGHADGHGGHDGHGGEALGPIDARMWGAAGLGVLLGLVVVVALLLSVGWLGGA